MTELIHTVADLTDLRNKDVLEAALARVIFELAEASSLSIWRVVNEGAEIKLRERVSLPAREGQSEEIGLDEARQEWRDCHAGRRYIYCPRDQGGLCRHVFPLCNEREVIGLLEILRPSKLEGVQAHTVHGLLRVYRNHLGLLDYGDRDELTGLLNRRTFGTYFKQITAENNVHAVIAVVDVDFFKRINDQFGHPYGDEVLILLARLMSEYFAGIEGIFRFGGEEFLLVLPETTQEEAWVALDAFRAAVAEAAFPQVGRVTVSIGFSKIEPDDSGAAAFGRADEALYLAKHSGRNRVKCYEELVLEGYLAGTRHSGGEIELF
ncbi:diguanylate cyclase [Acidocella aquatica]|uniref:diguanylate cyclase n=1 Tax=Acidocella aquatica TaxID=1922313 RepID=A0ABQ6A9D9_9PROT|nr:GGDEF domain-containing protein [Acidocella aquatica]GLR67222.1 diguanylate cyclase [Acidocella aquatica]